MAICAAAAVGVPTDPVLAQTAAVSFNIPAQPLSGALLQLGEQASLQIFFSQDVVAGFTAPAISGSLPPEAALQQLLAGTGIEFQRNGRNITLSPPASAAQVASAGSLKEVTVHGARSHTYTVEATETATHTDTRPVDIPFSIQSIPEQITKDQAVTTLIDTMRNVPGVAWQQGEGNRDQFTIRGNSTKSDFFRDGMRDDTEYYRDLYNIQQVDVLKGPAALLFGRGTAGGVFNLVQKKAARRDIRGAELVLGQWNKKRATFDLGSAVGDRGAFRINGMVEDSKGFRDYEYRRPWGINPTFSYWFSDATSIDLSYEHFEGNRRADRGIPSYNDRPAAISRSAFFGDRNSNRAEAKLDTFDVNFEHHFNDDLKFTNKFRAQVNDKYYRNLYPVSPLADDGNVDLKGYIHGNKRKTYQNQAELHASADTGSVRHKIITGLEYSHQKDDDYKDDAMPRTVNVGNPSSAVWEFAKHSRDNSATAKGIGLYAQDEITLNEHWQILAGVRWDRFTVDAHYHLLDEGTRHTDKKFSPRVGLVYKPTHDMSIYASYAQTFTPQGANVALSTKSPTGQDFGPEKAQNYEIGAKYDMFGGRLSLAGALYQLTMSNLTATDSEDELVQTGKQRTRGAELSLIGGITSAWNVSLNYGYMDSKFVRATKDVPIGNRPAMAPKHMASLWSTYAVDEHWGFGGGLRSQSSSYARYTNQTKLPSFTVADAMAYYQGKTAFGTYRLQFNVDNLFDKRYYPTAHDDNQIFPGAPRNIRVTLSASF